MELKSKQKPAARSSLSLSLSVGINQHISSPCLEAGGEVRERTQKGHFSNRALFFFFFTKVKEILLKWEARI